MALPVKVVHMQAVLVDRSCQSKPGWVVATNPIPTNLQCAVLHGESNNVLCIATTETLHRMTWISLPFARGCRVGVLFGFIRAALLPAVGTCVQRDAWPVLLSPCNTIL